MKKVAAILFLLVFLGVNTELHHFFRLPLLFHHYFEHHHSEHNKSFVDFLNEHYNESQIPSDNNHHEHNHLPLNSHDCSTSHINVVFVAQSSFSISKPAVFLEKISPVYNGAIYSSAFVSTVWQPPRAA